MYIKIEVYKFSEIEFRSCVYLYLFGGKGQLMNVVGSFG